MQFIALFPSPPSFPSALMLCTLFLSKRLRLQAIAYFIAFLILLGRPVYRSTGLTSCITLVVTAAICFKMYSFFQYPGFLSCIGAQLKGPVSVCTDFTFQIVRFGGKQPE